jgi:hypothetical protein
MPIMIADSLCAWVHAQEAQLQQQYDVAQRQLQHLEKQCKQWCQQSTRWCRACSSLPASKHHVTISVWGACWVPDDAELSSLHDVSALDPYEDAEPAPTHHVLIPDDAELTVLHELSLAADSELSSDFLDAHLHYSKTLPQDSTRPSADGHLEARTILKNITMIMLDMAMWIVPFE